MYALRNGQMTLVEKNHADTTAWFSIETVEKPKVASENWEDETIFAINKERAVAVLQETIDFFKKEMPKVKIHKPEGTYCLWMDFRAYGLSDEEVHKRIYEDAAVLLQDGTVHDPIEGHCFQRMCVPCARSVLMEACQRIAKIFEDVK